MGSLKFPQSPYIFDQLLTPEQVKMTDNLEETVEEVMGLKILLAIDNLMQYNAIVGMTETLPQSIKMLEHALGQIVDSASKKEEVQDFFSRQAIRSIRIGQASAANAAAPIDRA